MPLVGERGRPQKVFMTEESGGWLEAGPGWSWKQGVMVVAVGHRAEEQLAKLLAKLEE